MKNFIIISVSLLISLPVFAQQCEEGVAYSKHGSCNGPFDSTI